MEVQPLPMLRPKTRGDCLEGPRPCPWVSCRYNLYLDVNAKGRVKLQFKEIEPGEVDSTLCALDHSDSEHSPAEVAALTGIPRGDVLLIEERAISKLQKRKLLRSLFCSHGVEDEFKQSNAF